MDILDNKLSKYYGWSNRKSQQSNQRNVDTSTQRSPYGIIFGYESRMPININTQYNVQYSEANNMVDAQINQAIQYNKTREDIEYKEGDWVLIKREKLNTIKVNIDDQLKLLPRYCGPFKVVKKEQKNGYSVLNRSIKNGDTSIPSYQLQQNQTSTK
ncbi:hypothetical protein ACTA71_012371 [Dictyostelium dimigraforme]